MTRRRSPPHLATLVLLTGLTVLTLNMFLPSLPAITQEFGASKEVMGLAVSGYMIAAAVMQLVLGPVSDRVGRRPVLLAAAFAFVLASLVCAASDNSAVFIAARMVQSVIVAGAVLSSAVIRDLWDREDAAARLGLVSAAMAVAPMLGPALGGVLDTFLGWRAVFLLYAGLGAAALLLVWVDLGETRKTGHTASGGAVDLLREPRFRAYVLCMTFSVGTFFVFLSGAPYVAVAEYGLSSAEVGIGLGSITGGFMTGAALTARYSRRIGSPRMMVAGRFVALCGLCIGTAVFVLGWSNPVLFFATAVSVGLGNGLSMANANAGALSVRPEMAGTAAGFAGAAMVAGGAGLTAATLWVLGDVATPERLLTTMLASVVVSLVFALLAVRHEGRAVAAGLA